MKIAYIEDVPAWQRSIKKLLAVDGYAVTIFDSEPLDASVFRDFDIVISDHKLKFASNFGLDVLRNLRYTRYNGILVMLTSYPEDELKWECHNLDVHLITKNEDIRQAMSKIVEIEERSKLK